MGRLSRAERRLATRAARFGAEADAYKGTDEGQTGILQTGKRGAIEGPIRVPLRSSLGLFNVLMLLWIPSKSSKLQSVLFSIFTPLPKLP